MILKAFMFGLLIPILISTAYAIGILIAIGIEKLIELKREKESSKHLDAMLVAWSEGRKYYE